MRRGAATLKTVFSQGSARKLSSKMEGLGAYGGGKAGGAFDPVAFVQRPQVVLRAMCWVSACLLKESVGTHTRSVDLNNQL